MSQALAAPLSLATLEAEIGGRGQIIQALATAPQTKDVRYILGLLADPENQHTPLAEICKRGKVLPGTLLELIERGTKLRARIIAGQIIAQGTADVVRDVMKRARPYIDSCVTCGGVGTITADPTPELPNPSPQPCRTCKGGGQLQFEPDSECRKLSLEMAGLTAKGGGINIAVQQNMALPSGGGSQAFEALQELMDKHLYGRGPVIDADVVKPDSS